MRVLSVDLIKIRQHLSRYLIRAEEPQGGNAEFN